MYAMIYDYNNYITSNMLHRYDRQEKRQKQVAILQTLDLFRSKRMSRDKVYITFPWNHSTVEGLTVVQILLRVRSPHAPITPVQGILG